MADDAEKLDLSVTVGGASFTGAGTPDRVMAALERFFELVGEHGATQSAPRGAASEPQTDTAGDAQDEPAGATPPQNSAASKVPLPKFLERESIKKNPEIATAIVIWAADHNGNESLTTADIERYWKGTALKVPGNLSRDLKVAVRSGWLIRDGRNLSATGYGREAIGLPAS